MCVIFFYVNSSPVPGAYKLILASNRDEYYARRTQPVAKWADAEHVYGGIDLEPGREGGTWLALSAKNGIFKVGALLNLTGEPRPRNAVAPNNILKMHKQTNMNYNQHKTSSIPQTASSKTNNSLLGRGMIVADFVKSTSKHDGIASYNERLLADCTKYSAFNFVGIEFGSPQIPAQIQLLSNVPPTLKQYDEGSFYGFGNSLPEAPFEKVRYGRQKFESIVRDYYAQNTGCESHLVANLQDMLKTKTKFWPDAELHRRAPNWGEGLSALNVDLRQYAYGSRTHTVILVDDTNKLQIFEETMSDLDPAGDWQITHIEKQIAF